MLMTMAATVSTVGKGLVNPAVYLSPMAQAISNNPATTNSNQASDVFTSYLN
jgi:hypothetical protein